VSGDAVRFALHQLPPRSRRRFDSPVTSRPFAQLTQPVACLAETAKALLLILGPILRRPRADVDPLSLRAEQTEQLDGGSPGTVEPVRYTRVEFGGLAVVKHQIMRTKDQSKAAAQDVQPLIASCALGSGSTCGRLAGMISL